jgi:phosphoglycolate phosphatase
MKLVIFDVDGTLVNSEAIILGAQREAFRQCGLVFPGREAGLSVVGLTLDIALMQLAGLSQPDDTLTETYKRVFNGMRMQAETDPALAEPLYPGAADALARLAARPDVKLAIATGKSRRGADYIIERNGWRELFSSIQTADDAPSKPHPGMILNAMRETGATADQTWMIGDSSFDMAMAVAAGVTPVAVSWGFQPVKALREAGARHVVADYPALERLLLA